MTWKECSIARKIQRMYLWKIKTCSLLLGVSSLKIVHGRETPTNSEHVIFLKSIYIYIECYNCFIIPTNTVFLVLCFRANPWFLAHLLSKTFSFFDFFSLPKGYEVIGTNQPIVSKKKRKYGLYVYSRRFAG